MAERDSANTKMAGDWSRSLPLVICLCGLIPYSNSFSGVFVFDDIRWIAENPTIRQLWPPWAAASGTLRPLLMFSLALNYAVSGLEVWSYHLVNLTVHLGAALTLFGVVRRTLLLEALRDRYGAVAAPMAAATAMIWVAHPLQTQSVTYIMQRGESLMGLFYLLALYCVLRGTQEGGPWNRWFAVAVAANVLGLVTKEVMVTAPVVILLYDALLLSGSFAEALRQRWRLYAGLAAPLALGALWLLASNPARLAALFRGDSETTTALQYAYSQPGVVLHYLKLCLWPDPLFIDYGWEAARGLGDAAPSLALVVAALAGAVWCRRRRPELSFLAVWFFAILAPTSSIVPLRDLLVEHRMYLPLAAVTALGVGLIYGLRTRVAGRERTRVALGLALAVTVLLGSLTWMRNQQYQSEIALWKNVIEQRPENTRRLYQLGLQFYVSDQGILEEAIFSQLDRPYAGGPAEQHIAEGIAAFSSRDFATAVEQLSAAVQLEPASTVARNCLGIALFMSARPEEAAAEFEVILKTASEADVHNNLANVLLERGERDQALYHYRQALDSDSKLTEAHYNLGSALAVDGNQEEATRHFAAAILLQRNFPEALNNMGSAMLAMGQPKEAKQLYTKAIQQRPGYTTAELNYGIALLVQNKYDEAAIHFSRVLAADEERALAHNGMGICLYTRGDLVDGEIHFKRAIELRPDYADAQNNLANCALARGDLSVAVAHYARALRTHSDPASVHHNLGKALFFMGRTNDAVGQFHRAAELDPGYRAARANLEEARRHAARDVEGIDR